MAEALAAIGAFAAASQLAEQCLKMTLFFCELRSSLRESKKFIDTSTQQVEQLIGISREIIATPTLHTSTMANLLQACRKEAEGYHEFLESVVTSQKDNRLRRFRKSLAGFRARGTFQTRAASLDRWVGLLTLCIEQTQA